MSTQRAGVENLVHEKVWSLVVTPIISFVVLEKQIESDW
jgi:hypothetical protein